MRTNNLCIDCGKEITKVSTRCKACSNKLKGHRFKIGDIPHNKGKTKEDYEPSKKTSRKMKGKSNPMWKGNRVKRIALHNWVRRSKPKPKLCEKCGKNEPYDLANISGEYKRDINDFEWICRSCHMGDDGRLDNLHKNKRRKHKGNLIYCTKCKEFKTKEKFHKDKLRQDGYNKHCKECIKEYNQRPEVITKRREYQREYYQKIKAEECSN